MQNKSILPENSTQIPVEVSQQATEWYVRLQADDVTEQEITEFQTWLQTSQQHQKAWKCLEQFGLSLDSLKHPLLKQALLSIDQKAPSRNLFPTKSITYIIMLGGSIVTIIAMQPQQLWQQWQADYKTQIGEQKSIQLADGSQIILNTDTVVNVNYNHKQRQIELIKGEIHLEVAKDPQHRPFSVSNRDGLIQDIGTTFNIRQYDKHTVLAVSEGEVLVTATKSQNKAHVHAEQQVLFNQYQIQNIKAIDSKYSTWKNGMLSVYKMPLNEFLTELNRYSRDQLSYDKSVSKFEVSGVFPLKEYQKVLDSLEQQLPIKVESQFYFWKKITLKEK